MVHIVQYNCEYRQNRPIFPEDYSILGQVPDRPSRGQPLGVLHGARCIAGRMPLISIIVKALE